MGINRYYNGGKYGCFFALDGDENAANIHYNRALNFATDNTHSSVKAHYDYYKGQINLLTAERQLNIGCICDIVTNYFVLHEFAHCKFQHTSSGKDISDRHRQEFEADAFALERIYTRFGGNNMWNNAFWISSLMLFMRDCYDKLHIPNKYHPEPIDRALAVYCQVSKWCGDFPNPELDIFSLFKKWKVE